MPRMVSFFAGAFYYGVTILVWLVITLILTLFASIGYVVLGARPHRRAGTQPPSAENKEQDV